MFVLIQELSGEKQLESKACTLTLIGGMLITYIGPRIILLRHWGRLLGFSGALLGHLVIETDLVLHLYLRPNLMPLMMV